VFVNREKNSRTSARIKNTWTQSEPFKILSLDGGGVRGLYSAELLRMCEEHFCNGRPVNQHFDLIAGTSTGGIIALGLALGLSIGKIVEFYRGQPARRIFPNTSILDQVRRFRSPLFDETVLETELKNAFGDNLLGDAENCLVIPSFLVPKAEIAVLKTDHHRDYLHDWKMPAWQVARATSAAPTFFEGLANQQQTHLFLDGGIWCNNPVMTAIVEALSAFDIQPYRNLVTKRLRRTMGLEKCC
jgi:uncharacterized protein